MKLPKKFMTAVRAYCKAFGVASVDKIADTSKSIWKAWRKYRIFAVRLQCGLGKTTAAVCLIASLASRKNRFLLVCRDRDTVREKSATLGSLMGGLGRVGIVWGWNYDDCYALCGVKERRYKDCIRGAWVKTCAVCDANEACNYFQSAGNIRLPVAVTTAQSFLSLCERGHDFSKTSIIIDEDLSAFAGMSFTAENLRRIDQFLGTSHKPSVSGAMGKILPCLDLNGLRNGSLSDSVSIHNYAADKRFPPGFFEALTAHARRNIGMLESRGLDELVFNFIIFFRTTAQCGAAYTVWVSNGKVNVLKNRLSLRHFTGCRRMMLLDGSAGYSLNDLGTDMPVCTDPKLERKHNSGRLEIYAVIGNPTQSRITVNTELAVGMLKDTGLDWFSDVRVDGVVVLVPYNKDPESAAKADKAVADIVKELPGASIELAPAWRLRGVNDYGHCEVAFLVTAGTFTTVTHCGLCASLRLGRDIPVSDIINFDGSPRMCKGRFVCHAVQDAYARLSVSSLYQAIGRTAIRNGGDASVFVALPAPEWLVALYRLRPFTLTAVRGANLKSVTTFKGLGVILAMPAAARISKKDLARLLGYSGNMAWRNNRDGIKALVDGILTDDPGDRTKLAKVGVP